VNIKRNLNFEGEKSELFFSHINIKKKNRRVDFISRLFMIGGLGSSSATVLAGIENSFEALKFVWFIRKFGEGFGISSCRNGICHPPSQK